MKREQLKFEISQQCANCSLKKRFRENARSKFFGMRHHRGWESRLWFGCSSMWYVFKESGCLGMQPKMGGKYHLKLNIGERPIANKYREGKMKRTLKRELNSTWNCQKGNAWNQYCLVGYLFIKGCNPSGESTWLWLGWKGWENVAFGCLALRHGLGWSEDCSVCWWTRLL